MTKVVSIRKRLTYANVTATLGLFVALGGSAAAAGYVISNNSQLGPSTVAGSAPPSGKHDNIIPGSLTGFDIKPDSLGGPRILESTLGKVPNADRLDGVSSNGFVLGGGAVVSNIVRLAKGKDAELFRIPKIGIHVVASCFPDGWAMIHQYHQPGDPATEAIVTDPGSPTYHGSYRVNEGDQPGRDLHSPAKGPGESGLYVAQFGINHAPDKRVATMQATMTNAGGLNGSTCLFQAQALGT